MVHLVVQAHQVVQVQMVVQVRMVVLVVQDYMDCLVAIVNHLDF